MTLGSAPPPEGRRGLGLLLGLVGAVILGSAAGWFYFARLRPAATTVATLSPEALAAQARVRELEERIAQLEREKVEAETAAAEEARQKVEAQAGGRPVDPAAVQRAQDEARRRARAEQERRQQEEMDRLASEKQAEEQRLAEASPPPAPVPVATPTPTPIPVPPASAPAATGESNVPAGAPATGAATPAGAGAAPVSVTAPGVAEVPPPAGTSGAPLEPPPASAAAVPPATVGGVPPAPAPTPVRRGALVDVNDPTVTPPVLVRQPAVTYPELARVARVEGVVELRALVDENGSVVQVTLVKSSRPGYRFEAEAERLTRLRKYRPATKGGVPVRTWLPIVVNFKSTR
jgi:protein TonB